MEEKLAQENYWGFRLLISGLTFESLKTKYDGQEFAESTILANLAQFFMVYVFRLNLRGIVSSSFAIYAILHFFRQHVVGFRWAKDELSKGESDVS